MKHLLAIALLAVSSTTTAETYICVSDDGVTHYTSPKGTEEWVSAPVYLSGGREPMFIIKSTEDSTLYIKQGMDGANQSNCIVHPSEKTNDQIDCNTAYQRFVLDKPTQKYITVGVSHSNDGMDLELSSSTQFGSCEKLAE